MARQLPFEFLHQLLQFVAPRRRRSSVVSILLRLNDIHFVLLSDAVHQWRLNFVSIAVLHSQGSWLSLLSRQVCSCSIPSSFVCASGVVASVQHYLGRQAVSSRQFIDVARITSTSGAVTSVDLMYFTMHLHHGDMSKKSRDNVVLKGIVRTISRMRQWN